jgi:glucan 1,3-beta-glucosidase
MGKRQSQRVSFVFFHAICRYHLYIFSYSVNLGGLFVLEPFISPSLYQKYPGAVDEWTLSTLMAADTASGGLNQLEDHYNTFVTEQDIAEIAGAGLNWIRLPIPFWAIETWEGEPFLAKVSWK